MAMDMDVHHFLHQCRPSGDAAYAALKSVLDKLHHPDTRPQARVFLASLQKHVDCMDPAHTLSTFHFRIHQLSLSNYQGFQGNRQCLTLLELPSIFVPEDWSFTFFEGLSRHPDSSFRDRDIAELGCGNGWISIALAEKWSPHKVYGLDINPRAIKAAQINLYLNALHEDGSPVLDHEGKTLLDRVEFHESDLLAYCREKGILLDRIVGCIPQILNPDPEAMQKIVLENASEEFLYSLSNYCALQGFVEDQFGLGLIARAVEEGIGAIKPSGSMIFNVGGRPGQAVCERLFERRGFEIKKIWQTRVNQAADTDILALVEIEKNSRHRFEFFIGRVSEEPVCARTAWAYAKAGGEISHGLSVYSCRLRQPNQVKTIFKFLYNGFEETRGALDLSFKDESVAEEKIPFLAHLVTALEENTHIPYELPVGSTRFRNLIAGFMQLYHNIPIGSNNLIVFPSRAVAIESFLRLFSPKLALVDATLTRSLPKKWLQADPIKIENKNTETPDGEVVVIEAPKRADIIMQMLKLLKPDIVVTSLADFEMRSSAAFEQLLDACAQVGSRVLMDISDYIELSSLPGTNGVLQFLAVHPLPPHATIVCGLVKNKVYSDLEVAFVISENLDILHAMGKTLELINGRTAVSSQFYYGCLFYELLTFQLPDRYRIEQRPPIHEKQTSFIKINERVLATLQHAEMSSDNPISDVVHADFDENLLPAPLTVKMAIFEAFARQNLAESEMDPTPEILEFFNIKLGVPEIFHSEIVLSDSSTTLFTKLILACRDNNGTLLFASGSNGSYIMAANYLGANVKIIPTKQEDGFKMTVAGIHQHLKFVKQPWVYICGPTINPTGLVYSNDEIYSILTACQTYGAHVIIDTTFSGLEFGTSMPFTWNLKAVLSNFENSSSSVCFIGSTSELLTGGLEFNFSLFKGSLATNAFKEAPNSSRPHGTTLYSMKKLLGIWNHKPSILSGGLIKQKKVLQQRAKRMFEVLKDCGWDAIEPLGGVSMVARPTAYEGRKICYKDHSGQSMDIELHSQNIREAILHITGLSISSSMWICLPEYCRFVIALDDADFIRALQALQDFKTYVLG